MPRSNPTVVRFKQLTQWAERLAPVGPKRPWVIAIAGPPGSGKSTFAEALRAHWSQRVEILPMDGFHYDNAVLEAHGWRARKGAPHTFDLTGFHRVLKQVSQLKSEDVAVPVFDRTLDLSRGSARLLPRDTDIVLVEGNYLLLDQPGWRNLRPLFDVSLMLTAPSEVLVDRLTQRWLDHGFDPAQAAEKVNSNDLLNLEAVHEHSLTADWTCDIGDL